MATSRRSTSSRANQTRPMPPVPRHGPIRYRPATSVSATVIRLPPRYVGRNPQEHQPQVDHPTPSKNVVRLREVTTEVTDDRQATLQDGGNSRTPHRPLYLPTWVSEIADHRA